MENVKGLLVWVRAGYDGSVKKPYWKEVNTFYNITTKYPDHPVGIALTGNGSDYNLVIIDIDDSLDLPEFLPLTYIEFSQSGTGQHLVYRLPKNEHKFIDINGSPASIPFKFMGFHGEIKYGYKSYIHMTGKPIPNSIGTVTELSHSNLLLTKYISTTIPLISATTDTTNATSETQVHTSQNQKTPKTLNTTSNYTTSIKQLTRLVMALPLNSGEKIRAAWKDITNLDYLHYSFWSSILMAIHHESTRLLEPEAGLALAVTWSKTDKTGAYKSEKDVATHYLSFQKEKNNPITIATIRALVAKVQVIFPDTTKRGIDVNSPTNISVLLDAGDIKCYGDQALITANADARPHFLRYTKPDLFGFLSPDKGQTTMALNFYAHSLGWKGKGYEKKIYEELQARRIPPPDYLRMWWETPLKDLPREIIEQDNVLTKGAKEYSTFTTVANAFHTNGPRDLALTLLKKTFMQVIKFSHTSPFIRARENEGFLILTGKQRSGKTTFFKMWLPKPLSFLYWCGGADLSSAKDNRDFMKDMAEFAIINFDEFQWILEKDTSNAEKLKQYLTSTDSKSTQIYKTNKTIFPRRATLVATTNKRQMRLPEDGLRRFWIIDIDHIELDKIDPSKSKFSLTHFYNSLREEFDAAIKQGISPWVTTEEEAAEVTKNAANYVSRTNAELEIIELLKEFPIKPITRKSLAKVVRNPDGPGTQTQVIRMCTVNKLLNLLGHRIYKPAFLHNALRDIAVEYMGGAYGEIHFMGGPSETTKMTWKDGQIITHGVNRGYLLPPLQDSLRSSYGRND